MTKIKRRNRLGANPLGGGDHHGVHQPQVQRAVLSADGVRASDILVLSVLDGEGSVCDIGQERLLRAG